MKPITIALSTAILSLGITTAVHANTPIRFTPGSYCGSFDGNVVGRKFTLQLKANQLLSIEMIASKPIYPIVKDPIGRTLAAADDSESYIYNATRKGKYTVSFELEDESYPYAEIKFCAA